jgi:UDP-N-acetylmuramate dehydrogenase
MGGGSNILFTKDYNGIIIQPALKGINIIENDNKSAL